jgi:hypothetical protein
VDLWIGVSGKKVEVNIVRRGFMLTDPVMPWFEHLNSTTITITPAVRSITDSRAGR